MSDPTIVESTPAELDPPTENAGPAAVGPDPIASSGAVGETLRALGQLDDAPLAEHPEIYQRIHENLRGELSGIDQA